MNEIDGMACATPGCDNRGKPGLNLVGYGSFATKFGRRRRYQLHHLQENAEHEHGDRVPRASLHPTGVRPRRQPASRRREHFFDGPSHGPFT